MRYYKYIENGYLLSIGTGFGSEEITAEEYENILTIIKSRPASEVGYGYRLKTDLAWELVELTPVSEDEEISADEALKIILGGEA